MKVLITGCGRSGTGYAAMALQSVGLKVGHENIDANGTSDWRAVLWGPTFLKKFDLITHQVRHPLKVIASWHVVTPQAWHMVSMATGINLSEPLLRRSMDYWVRWNLMAESVASETYRVEDFRASMGRILDGLPLDWAGLPTVSESYNSLRGREDHAGVLTWSDLEGVDAGLTKEIRELASRYGYDG